MPTLTRPHALTVSISVGTAVIAAAIAAGMIMSSAMPRTPRPTPVPPATMITQASPVAPSASPKPAQTASPEAFAIPAAVQLAALPDARYDAVIPELMPFQEVLDTTQPVTAYRLTHDVALYGGDRTAPVARLSAWDFTAQPTTTIAVEQDGGWTRVLTPARQALPSQSDGHAPAQSAAWVRTSALPAAETIDVHVTISVGAQTMTIRIGTETETFSIGVGQARTPTPTNVSGYLEARFSDPSQASGKPISLTTLHATASDEPYLGSDGGLIALHWAPTSAGAVSHGCLRIDDRALAATQKLPIGTPITITR